MCEEPLKLLTCLVAGSVFLALLWSIRQWHAILMQPSTVVGKSIGQALLLYQRAENSETETQR